MARSKNAGPFGGFAPNTANFMGNLFFHPCSVPLTVYVKTFVPVFVSMVVFILTPDFNDIVRSSGEAAARGGARSGRGKRRHAGGYVLPSPEGKATRRARQGLQTVLRLSQPLETIGYAMLLYFATERLFYQWSSVLYNFEHCGQPPSTGPFQRESLEQDVTSTGTPQPLFLPILLQNRANWGTSFNTVTVPFGRYQITMECKFQSRAINNMEARIGIIAPFSNAALTVWSDEVLLRPGQQGDCIVQFELNVFSAQGTTVTFLRESDPIPVGIKILAASISMYSLEL